MSTFRSEPPQGRSDAFDRMRCLALAIILLHHLPEYAGDFYQVDFGEVEVGFGFVKHVFRYLGLGLFVFMSGHLLGARYGDVTTLRDAALFCRKRLRKIYPLYWIVLPLYAFMYVLSDEWPMDLRSDLLHLLGAQLFYPSPLPTLWYVGLVVTFYLLFVGAKLLGRWIGDGAALALVLAGLILLKAQVPAVDGRLILYWPVFAFGILFPTSALPLGGRRLWGGLLVAVLALLAYHSALNPSRTLPPLARLLLLATLLWPLMAAWALLAHRLCSVGLAAGTSRWTYGIAYSSYAIYLFHRPVYQACESLLGAGGWYDSLPLRSLAFVATTIVLVSGSYLITRHFDRLGLRLNAWMLRVPGLPERVKA